MLMKVLSEHQLRKMKKEEIVKLYMELQSENGLLRRDLNACRVAFSIEKENNRVNEQLKLEEVM